MLNNIIGLILTAPAILFALTVHEVAHGWVANRLGDPTAKLAGRLTLNPIKHIDIIGILCMFIFRFGWAKPVPVNSLYLKNPKRDIIFVSLAGPAVNFLSGIIFSLILRGMLAANFRATVFPFYAIVIYAVLYNFVFGIFNLIPIPPLDGSQILYHLLPASWAQGYAQVARYGMFFLLGIILLGTFTGFSLLWSWIGPTIGFLTKVFVGENIFQVFHL
jgi:Zn-dependent protease